MPFDATVDIPTIRYTPYATQLKPTVTGSASAAWSVTGVGGSVSPGSGLTTLFTPPNKTGTARVTGVAAGPETDFVDILVYATVPIQPNFGYELDFDNNTLRSPAEDGGAVLRRKGIHKRSWQVQYNNLDNTEWTLLREFYKYHLKDIPFYMEDLAVLDNVGGPDVYTLALVTFDSGLKVTVAGDSRYNVTAAYKEV
jgi:hypothetical protein